MIYKVNPEIKKSVRVLVKQELKKRRMDYRREDKFIKYG